MTRALDLQADVIDVRDIIARIEELEASADTDDEGVLIFADPDELEERLKLRALLQDLALCGGGDEQFEGVWYPITLIRDAHFTRYCMDFVDDIGDLPCGLPSYIEIDWEATARNIQMDYSSVEIDGETYWTR